MKELLSAIADFTICNKENHDCKHCKCHVTMKEVHTVLGSNQTLCGILAVIIKELEERRDNNE